MVTAVLYIDVPAFVLCNALQPDVIAISSVGTVDNSELVRCQAYDRQICPDTTRVIKKMRVDPFADCGVATDFGNASIFHQDCCISTGNIVDRKMGKVNHAGIIRHGEVLGIGDPPEMAVVPFVFTNRNFVAVFFEQMFV